MSPPAAMPAHRFPDGFIWGVATAAFQVEGAGAEDGKAPSVWDTFCRRPGVIADGSNGDVACDHYHRLDADLDLIARLGVNAYRFSVSWPRVQPLGQGAWNEKGLDFYERLVDGLLARGVQPHLTLNHWDLPQALQDLGGWMQRDTVHRFVEYAQGINARLGDRLASTATHNEPWVVATLGHDSGIFAPGIQSRRAGSAVAHHLLLSHGLALQALRAQGGGGLLGIVLNQAPIEPATASAEDAAAARLEDGKLVRWYMDPLFKGHYPEDVLAVLGDDGPPVQPGDLADIAQPLDWLGLNYYSRSVVSATGDWDNTRSGLPLTEMGWEIYPQGLTDLLKRLHRDYAPARIVVAENGGAFPDAAWHDGPEGREVADDDRCDYLARHIAAVGDAAAAGVPMTGYMVWSLMDNFEWASGYAKRFGIVHVDYATLARTPKRSARWYRDFLAAQRQRAPGA